MKRTIALMMALVCVFSLTASVPALAAGTRTELSTSWGDWEQAMNRYGFQCAESEIAREDLEEFCSLLEFEADPAELETIRSFQGSHYSSMYSSFEGMWFTAKNTEAAKGLFHEMILLATAGGSFPFDYQDNGESLSARFHNAYEADDYAVVICDGTNVILLDSQPQYEHELDLILETVGFSAAQPGDEDELAIEEPVIDNVFDESFSEPEADAPDLAAHINTVVADCRGLQEEGRYSEALEILAGARDAVGDHEEFTILEREIRTLQFESRMRSAAEEDDLATMARLYNEAMRDELITVSPEMIRLVTEKKSSFRGAIIRRAVESYRKDGYTVAISVISEGLAVLPDDEKLLSCQRTFASCAPVTAAALAENYLDASWDGNHNEAGYSPKSVEDSYGNSYDGYIYFSQDPSSKREPYITLNLNRSCQTLDAQCFVTSRNSEDTMGLRIYADDVLIYDSGLNGKLDQAEHIVLDVRNVLALRLEGYGYSSWGGRTIVYLAGGTLTGGLSEAQLKAMADMI